jgi:signal transduction histidine kinase
MSVANKALRDARNESRKNAAILEGVAEGVIVLGPNHQIVLANQAASELIGNQMTKVGPLMESAEIGGRVLSFRWSEVQGVGWVAIVRDISRQIEIEHAKDAILRVVSHEMRTPLASILGFAEILESQSIGMATQIRSNAQRMLKLVNDLLDVAQLQAGVLTIQEGSFSPSVLKSYVLENFLKPAEAKGIVLEVHSSPDLPEQVTGDVQRLEQVVSNLVGNAIKFTEREGRVDVSFCTENVREWQIIVRDTGMGIPPERLTDIFEPFRRASDYARRKHQGIGLGLSIVKKIVQLSGGDISVKSILGEGSTFTVTLPTESVTS